MNVYWDTSALAAVYLRDACTKQATTLFQSMRYPASSWLCYSEMRAAFRACKDAKKISAVKHADMVERFEKDWGRFHKIPVKSTLSPELRRIFQYHSLRGADAVHLASAILLNMRLAVAHKSIIFACDDERLATAAEVDGLKIAWKANRN
jgi:predicted nucleic acid-binding protein